MCVTVATSTQPSCAAVTPAWAIALPAAASDISVTGGAGDDIVRGGSNDDAVRGGAGIDQVYGDDGSDNLFGDSGNASNSQLGQRLYGGNDIDYLFAFAATTNPATELNLIGDQLFGESGGDWLYGNLRKDILIGGNGNDNLFGDWLAGPAYALNTQASITGSDDLLMGGSGESAAAAEDFRITAKGVIGAAALLGVVNMVLFTALATLGSFIYNVCADLVGGVELTLAERD